MFSNRDIPPVLLLFLLICVIIATLSQILVVHNRGKQVKISHNMLAVQKELREIDQNIESTVNKNIPSQEYKEYKLQLKVFQRKISEMIKKSSQLSQNSTTQTAPRRNVQKISSDSNEQNNRKHSIHNYRIRSKSGVYKNRNITHQYIIKTGRSIISSDTSKKTDRERLHYCPEFPPDLSKYT